MELAEASNAIYDNTSMANKDVKNFKVIKRNGNETVFDASKIYVAITKAFLEVEGSSAAASSKIHAIVPQLTNDVIESLARYKFIGGRINIEDIQDQVELALMRRNEFTVAKAYIVYREEHRKIREAKNYPANGADHSHQQINITLKDGSMQQLDQAQLLKLVQEACKDLTNVNPASIVTDTIKNIFNGIHEDDVRKALIMTARTYIETEPNYSLAASRLLLNDVRVEVADKLNVTRPKVQEDMRILYSEILKKGIQYGILVDRLDIKLMSFDLEKLGAAINHTLDFKFNYLGLQTLYDRYFLHEDDIRYELPQTFFMRVAMGLALQEDNPTERAIEFYRVLSNFDFMSSTPTLFNSGTIRSQLSSCFLSTIPDDLLSIYDAIKDNALLQKFAGGIGNDCTPIRAIGAKIKGTNGKSQGVIPFLNVINSTALAVNQGGKRKGAVCAYLETWHLDIEEFLELRKNTGDDRRRTHDTNTANWIPDLFMKRVFENKEWTLFSPDDTPDLHDLYGAKFTLAYEKYEDMATKGLITNYKRLSAVNLWRKMLSMLFETGHPWITFKDVCNLRSPQQHVGVVHSSNLCTEITLNTSKEEIAVCNLGSINLTNHLKADGSGLDLDKIAATTKTAIRMLDNVIEINYYAVDTARNSNLQHRPIGLGIMGFQDALYKMDISYESNAAVQFADTTMEQISYYAISASCELAKERGKYNSFDGSLWSKGILPLDSIKFVQENRGQYLDQDTSSTLNWESLRAGVMKHGMRNSNVMAIAPTATISNICGVSQSIEPTYQNLYVKSNLSGEFTVINQHLVADLKQLNIWDNVMINDLKFFNGSVQKIDRIPEHLKKKYATAFEIDPTWLIDAASRRQKWIDQAQSLNLYLANPSGKKLDSLYKHSWIKGLKTNYYLRTLGATDAEKATINRSTLNAVVANIATIAETVTGSACSIDDPTCEACQ